MEGGVANQKQTLNEWRTYLFFIDASLMILRLQVRPPGGVESPDAVEDWGWCGSRPTGGVTEAGSSSCSLGVKLTGVFTFTSTSVMLRRDLRSPRDSIIRKQKIILMPPIISPNCTDRITGITHSTGHTHQIKLLDVAVIACQVQLKGRKTFPQDISPSFYTFGLCIRLQTPSVSFLEEKRRNNVTDEQFLVSILATCIRCDH